MDAGAVDGTTRSRPRGPVAQLEVAEVSRPSSAGCWAKPRIRSNAIRAWSRLAAPIVTDGARDREQVMQGDLRRERRLGVAARQDRDDLARRAEVGPRDPALVRLERSSISSQNARRPL